MTSDLRDSDNVRDAGRRHDPERQWADLLSELSGRSRASVVSALRCSAESGWPADREGVRVLVDYALGYIDAQDYAIQMLVALGLVGGMSPVPVPVPVPVQEATPAEVRHPLSPQPLAAATPPTASGITSRGEAVEAYVSGSITVEEFLRISRSIPH